MPPITAIAIVAPVRLPMRILLLTHSFNGLSQRLHVELSRAGHELAVELDINDDTTAEAVELFRPDVILAPFLKRRIPESIWQAVPCLIVHPGPPGDRGPAALDWAVLDDRPDWGVTVLQADAELDAGPVWAWRTFAMRPARKSALYRFEVTEAAVAAVFDAVDRLENAAGPLPEQQVPASATGWRGPVRAQDRRVDWQHDSTATILRKIHSADGHPGVSDEILGLRCRLFNAHPEPVLAGHTGQVIARRGEAICRATIDGAIWISHLRPEHPDGFKRPATDVLGERLGDVPESEADPIQGPDGSGYQPVRYREDGDVGYLHFDFYNGAMGTEQCHQLRAAFEQAAARPTRVIVLAGGEDFWSNGLDLNRIEAAASPADESWRNIQAMDDLCEAIITATDHLVIAAIGGNAGAGGVFLALGADRVIARAGVVLNPHYRNMGNLYGSEFWTYLLPGRVGADGAEAVMAHRLPLGAQEAADIGLVDAVGPSDRDDFDRAIERHAGELCTEFAERIEGKRQRRDADEAVRPLADYRAEELERMRLNFYGFDPSYHVARYRFVHRSPHAWTPLYLAPHRRLGWRIPAKRQAGA